MGRGRQGEGVLNVLEFSRRIFLIGAALWVLWHVWQIRSENREYDEAVRLYKEVDIEGALRQGGSEFEAKAEQVRKAMQQEAGG